MTLKLRPKWPFIVSSGTEEAKRQYQATIAQRSDVERLARDLVRRGHENHFAEQLQRAFRGR